MRLLLALASAVGLLSAAPIYRITNLGTAGQISASGSAISNSGAVAGTAETSGGGNLAVTWTSAGTTAAGFGIADAINNRGEVAGTSWIDGRPTATVWTGANVSLLDFTEGSYANGISDAGEVAGSFERDGASRAFFSGASGVVEIDTPGSWAAAYDLNNRGQVVGSYESPLGGFRAFSWTKDAGLKLLGTLGGQSSYAMAVSESGSIAGSSTLSSGYLHAFLYDGVLHDLGTLGGGTSAAYDVNSRGTVVGYSFDALGRQRAFVWTDGMLWDLNAVIDGGDDWSLEAAYGINERGQIVGAGQYGGKNVAFLLDPVHQLSRAAVEMAAAPLDAAVPEPATGLIPGIAMLGLAAFAAAKQTRSGTRK